MIKFFSKLKNNKKGFTLVELMVVVVIIGVLVAIAVPVYNNTTANAQKNACWANQRTLEGAATAYHTDTGSWPANVAALVSSYIQSNPKCPKANATGYEFNTTGKIVTFPTGCDHSHY